MNLKALTCAAVLLAAPLVGHADAVDDTIDRINKYTSILESDATRYETVYPDQAAILVSWRSSWEQIADLRDAIYYLDVIDAALDRLEIRLDFLERQALTPEGATSIESRVVSAAANDEMNQLDGLVRHPPPILNSVCDASWLSAVQARVPLDTILRKESPDVGTLPVIQVHPTLAVSFVLDNDGRVELSAAPYTSDQANAAQGKWQIPSIVSTVSWFIYLQFHPEAYTPAAAIAAFALVVATEVVNRYNDARVADAVRKLRGQMDRLFRAQESGFAKVESGYPAQLRNSCETSFSQPIAVATKRFGGTVREFEKAKVRLSDLSRRSGAVAGPQETWDEVECEVFGCPSGAGAGLLTRTPDELVDRMVSEIRK